MEINIYIIKYETKYFEKMCERALCTIREQIFFKLFINWKTIEVQVIKMLIFLYPV